MFHVAFLSMKCHTYSYTSCFACWIVSYLSESHSDFIFSPEAFHRSIIPAVSFSLILQRKIMFTDQLPVFRCTVGGASIRGMIQPGFPHPLMIISSNASITSFFIVASAHRDPYGHISIQIQNTGYVEFSRPVVITVVSLSILNQALLL